MVEPIILKLTACGKTLKKRSYTFLASSSLFRFRCSVINDNQASISPLGSSLILSSSMPIRSCGSLALGMAVVDDPDAEEFEAVVVNSEAGRDWDGLETLLSF